MEHLSSDEIRQRFIQYFKELEAGQGHKQVLFEDQLLSIIVKCTLRHHSVLLSDWVLPFSDIEEVRQAFDHYYLLEQFDNFFERIIDALKGSDVIRKKQFLDIICKEMQIIKNVLTDNHRDLQDNQNYKEKFNELIKNGQPISGEFLFELYQNRYIQLKQTYHSEYTDTDLIKKFSDQDEGYISHLIYQYTQSLSILSAIRLILLKDIEITEQIEDSIANNRPIDNQSYYNCLKNLSPESQKELFNKLCNNSQYFIDIITRIISKKRLSGILKRYGGDEYIIYIIQQMLQAESKDFIAFYIQNNPNNIINFLKECDFISPTDKEFEKSLADQKIAQGEFILKNFEQKFFIDPLKKIAQEENVSFDEEGFYQIRKDKEQKAFESICKLPIYALDIAFLLADGGTLSNNYAPQLRELVLQTKKALSQLNLFPYELAPFIRNILDITKSYYPQFSRRYDSIIDNFKPIQEEIEKEKTKKEQKKKKEEEPQKSTDILIKTIRIKGFRGLENIEIDLEKTTVLTGANNTGKSSVLYALEIALGSRLISQEDFFIKERDQSKEDEYILIDLLIVPIDTNKNRCDKFSKNWESLFGSKNMMQQDDLDRQFVPLRTKVTFDNKSNTYKPQKFVMPTWPENNSEWFSNEDGETLNAFIEEIPFLYMDGQRDILKDIQSKASYLGKMLSKVISFNESDPREIEDQSKKLNEKVIKENNVLKTLKSILEELNSAMDTQSKGIEITLFTKKIRDLYKGLSIYYADQKDSFSMEYHGMGTRSWSSLLTLKALIKLLESQKDLVFFPIVAIEEPEAHLHPNAQKRLYHQIDSIEGQKIISTHSPYVTAAASIKQIRNLYKDQTNVVCGQLDMNNLSTEENRKIDRQVVNTRGEILFSKFLILCEGETEEQALPIFAKKHFKDKEPLLEVGLNVVGVLGHNYRPFLKFAKSFKIPFVIFSDAESSTKNEVKKQLDKHQLEIDKYVVFLDDGKNFETQLIADGFENELKDAIIDIKGYKNTKEEEKIKNLTQDELRKKFENNKENKNKKFISKARLGPAIADRIIESEKELPPKVKELFEKVSKNFKN